MNPQFMKESGNPFHGQPIPPGNLDYQADVL